jgi:hypothetical protein
MVIGDDEKKSLTKIVSYNSSLFDEFVCKRVKRVCKRVKRAF